MAGSNDSSQIHSFRGLQILLSLILFVFFLGRFCRRIFLEVEENWNLLSFFVTESFLWTCDKHISKWTKRSLQEIRPNISLWGKEKFIVLWISQIILCILNIDVYLKFNESNFSIHDSFYRQRKKYLIYE